MPATGIIIGTIVSIIFAVLGGHLVITQILPKLKNILTAAFKEPKAVNLIILIVMIYIGVHVLQKLITLVESFGIEKLNLIKLINPAIEIILNTEPTIRWLLIAAVIGLALKK